MLLIDLSHTSHTRARSGIQRVCRSLLRELERESRGTPVTWDPHAATWRGLEGWERSTLSSTTPGLKRGAQWPLSAQLRGRFRRLLRLRGKLPVDAEALLLPELFSSKVEAALPALRRQVKGPAVAVFHDAIALKLPELTPRATVARMPAYLQSLARLDGVAAVSEESRQALLGWWDWSGLRNLPPVCTIPLGVDTPSTPAPRQDAPSGKAELLCLCTLEARKNHLSLLSACELLWKEGLAFSLHLAGHIQQETAGPSLALIDQLKAAGRPLHHSGPISEEAVEEAYARCYFSVYPSLMEGFGLPVLESLVRGKPCICSAEGALGEAAREGGCLLLADTGTDSLAAAIRRLLTEPELYSCLREEASRRQIRSWSDYARQVEDWTLQLPRRGT